jgi:MoaA/NifB/PqqE/SkfB family radical SAM enzyme
VLSKLNSPKLQPSRMQHHNNRVQIHGKNIDQLRDKYSLLIRLDVVKHCAHLLNIVRYSAQRKKVKSPLEEHNSVEQQRRCRTLADPRRRAVSIVRAYTRTCSSSCSSSQDLLQVLGRRGEDLVCPDAPRDLVTLTLCVGPAHKSISCHSVCEYHACPTTHCTTVQAAIP